MVLLVAVGSAAVAHADEKAAAKAFFQAGAQAYDAGRYQAAAEAFREAYRLAPLPAILFSMAQAERRLFFVEKQRPALARALQHYRSYLGSNAPTRRAEAADALAELEALALRMAAPAPAAAQPAPAPAVEAPTKARLLVTTQAPKATVALDGGAPVEVPFIGDVEPGRHRVRVSAAGFHDEEREVEVALGAPVGLDLPLREKPGLLTVADASGAEVHVDGRSVGETPFLRPLELPSGTHSITLTRRGMHPWTEEVNLERGELARVQPEMERTGQRVAAYVVLGAAGVAAAGGVLSALAADERWHRADEILAEKEKANITRERLDEYNAAVQATDRWRIGAEAAFGTGAVLLTVGTLLYVLDRPVVAGTTGPRAKEQKTPVIPFDLSAGVQPLPGGVGVSATGRF